LRISTYLPMQPGFKQGAAYYIERKPETDWIANYVKLFYQFKHSCSSGWIPVVPDGCIDIIFCCHPSKPSCYIYGSVLNSKQLYFQTECEHFGIRMLAGQSMKILSHSIAEFIDALIPLVDILSTDCSDILDQICEATFFERIRLFNNLLTKRVTSNLIKDVPNLINYVLQEIYSHKGNVKIDVLANKTGYSTRYIRKKFEEHLGLSPKFFSQIIRFQNALYMFDNMYTPIDIASELGYYDQSHLINEFKRFHEFTPSEFSRYLKKANLPTDLL
jgi:AraC-like DNA-binding protein